MRLKSSKIVGNCKCVGSRVSLCGFGLLLSVSCQSNGVWLAMCADLPLSALNPRAAGYLAHVFDADERITLLQLTANVPENPGCESRELPIGAEGLVWAGFAKPASVKAKSIVLQGRKQNGRFAVSEIDVIDGGEEARESRINIVKPLGKSRTVAPLRASWFWSPAAWLESPHRIFDAQARLGLRRIYITVPVVEGRVRDVESLRQFLQTAHQRGLQVWSVLGDSQAVLEQERPHFLTLAEAYQAFNADGEQRLDGLQLDIEPYLLPGYQLNPSVWMQKQAETVNAVHRVAPSLPLDMVLPFWFEPLRGDGAAVLAAVESSITGITVMNYRTDPEQIREFAEKFLVWGELRQKAVFIALESLAMPEEERRVYTQAEHGELWRFDFKAAPVLLLLPQGQDLPGGRGYRFSHSRTVDGSNTSFFRQPEALNNLLPVLEHRFGAWASFAGMALHGQE